MTEAAASLYTDPRAEAWRNEEPPAHLDELGDGAWTVRIGERRAVFFVSNDGVIAIDTFGTPGKARAYKKAISEAAPGAEITAIVYTHDHLDHAGWAAELAPGAEIIAHSLAADVIESRGFSPQIAPTVTFDSDSHTVEIGGRSIELVHPGPTHGQGNVAVAFSDMLYMEGTALPNARYGMVPDYHVYPYVSSMQRLLERDFATFIPGRFDPMTKDDASKAVAYFAAIQEVVQHAWRDFVPVWMVDAMGDYAKAGLRDDFGDLDGFEEALPMTALRIAHHYLMGGWGLEDRRDGVEEWVNLRASG